MTARRFGAPLVTILVTSVFALTASPSVPAAGLPVVVSATVNYSQSTLTISGQNFGSSPAVTLDSMTFPTISSSSGQIVADFPNSAPPSSFTPGTYFLTVAFKNQLPAVFAATIGATGPAGPAGAEGPAGSAGATGATGPAGPAGVQGAMGIPGPAGSAGPVGPAGAAGPAGATGQIGLQGVQGTAGLQGPQGPPGVANVGSVSLTVEVCTASATVQPTSALVYIPGHAFSGYSDPTSGAFTFDTVPNGTYSVVAEQLGSSLPPASVSPVAVTNGSATNIGIIDVSNYQTDSANCGGCGIACSSGQMCSAGTCMPGGTCAAGQVLVGGVCVCNGSSCTGCCSGTTCLAGSSNTACGGNGTACTNCQSSGRACASNACTSATCSTDSDCAAGSYCNASNVCAAKISNGSTCSAADGCLSGFCVSGFCCNSACTGAGLSCSGAVTGGTNGVCAACAAGTVCQ